MSSAARLQAALKADVHLDWLLAFAKLLAAAASFAAARRRGQIGSTLDALEAAAFLLNQKDVGLAVFSLPTPVPENGHEAEWGPILRAARTFGAAADDFLSLPRAEFHRRHPAVVMELANATAILPVAQHV